MSIETHDHLAPTADDKIECKICSASVHAIALHLKDHHKDVTIEEYEATYKGAPLMSPYAAHLVAQRRKVKDDLATSATISAVSTKVVETTVRPMYEIFGLGKRCKAAFREKDGEPLMVEVAGSTEWDMQIPEVDECYVFEVEVLKNMLMGIVLNIPTFLWGHSGTGKTSMLEQICARLRRPTIRVQHTGSTEEAHIVGQMAADPARGTYFSPGPLPLAMKYGWTYIADEYDFGHPQVMALYQAVLEGKPLIIKDAPAESEWRIVHPHPHFRIMATGNTNGSGDSSGLYLGTNIQNAANFERFGIVEQMNYMQPKQEAAAIAAQAGIAVADAERLVRFASMVRESFEARKIGSTIGPRVLINAAKTGVARGSFMKGLHLSFLNRLTPVDKEVCKQSAIRVLES
jgi:cobaltochelatase CobS